jgi:AcrR family transcriptional regulator
MTREKLLDVLVAMFRKNGYDGTSVADITAATGLGKSSLYHHFPGGKAEIAVAMLEHLSARLRPALEALRDGRPPQAKLEAFLDAVDELYDGGRMACLLERLCASVDRRRFAKPLEASFHGLVGAFEGLCREAGLSRADARARAEDAVVRIEGSLVLAAGTDDPRVFRRALDSIRATLLAPRPR